MSTKNVKPFIFLSVKFKSILLIVGNLIFIVIAIYYTFFYSDKFRDLRHNSKLLIFLVPILYSLISAYLFFIIIIDKRNEKLKLWTVYTITILILTILVLFLGSFSILLLTILFFLILV